MSGNLTNKNAIAMNLTDAGCDDGLTESCLAYLEAGDIKTVLNLLAKHRRYLLQCFHADKKKISCLDYLIHHLNQ